MADFKLIHGIYESVITHALEERLSRISDSFDVEKNQLDSEESSFALALHLTKLIANSLASIKGDDKQQRQAQFCNQLLDVIGKNDPYESLKKTLKAEIDKDAWESMHNDISRPFDPPETGRIAVNIINHLGDEVLKVYG